MTIAAGQQSLIFFFSWTPILVPLAVIAAGAIPIWMTNRRWTPMPQPARPLLTRRLEPWLLAGLAAPLLLLLLFERRTPEYVPLLFAESTPEVHRQTLAWGMGIGVAAVITAVVCSWRFSTTLAVALLGGVFMVGTFAIDMTLSRQHQEIRAAKQDPDQPIRIRMQLPGQLAGADLSVNGVLIGQLPYETTVQELFENVPVWTFDDKRNADKQDEVTDWQYGAAGHSGSTTGRWGSMHMSIPHALRDRFPARQFFVRVDLNGMVGLTRGTESEGASDGAQTHTLDTKFVDWEAEITQLLDRARMDNYQPPAEWYDAFASYESWGRNRLQVLSISEPALLKLVDGRANHVYELDRIQTADQAWATLMQICDEAVSRRSYASDSCHGRAVDRLVPLLDRRQLITEALQIIEQVRFPQGFARSHRGGAEPWFRSFRTETWSSTDVLAFFPLAHAVWRLDRMLDEQQPDTDNIVEQQVTPAILRRVFVDPSLLQYAGLFGGTAYDTFLLRQDCWSESAEYSDTVSVGDSENRVNKWYMQLANLDSPAGRDFRRTQRDRLLKIAEQACTEFEINTGSLPGELDYLFLDREFTAEQPSLAMAFWPKVDRLAATISDPHSDYRLRMRLEYLGRLWPESTPDMFVRAYLKQPPERHDIRLPETMAVDDRFFVILAIHEAMQEQILTLTKKPNHYDYTDPYNSAENAINDTRRLLEDLPCTAGAAMFVAAREEDPSERTMERLLELMAHDSIHEEHVELLAKHESPRLRRAALPAIRHHPIARRLRLLEVLRTDEDPGVRQEALRIHNQLEDLQAGPLPFRTVPAPN